MLHLIEAPVQSLCDELPQAPHSGGVFTVVTINVWFGKLHQRMRFKELFRLLDERQPDVVAFQEVTHEFLAQLKDQEWTANYRWVDDHGPHLGHYGVAILTKFPIRWASYVELPSDMGRTILCAQLDFDGKHFTIATTHLESLRKNAECRAQQLDIIGALLSEQGVGVLCGDFNFCASWPLENDRLAAYGDVWEELRPGEDGFTLDPTVNRMQAGSELTPVRFDRMLFFGEHGWTAKTIELFATEHLPEQPEVWPSDHFGLIAVIA